MSMTGRRIGPEAILSAITAEQPAIESLLEELVSAPALLQCGLWPARVAAIIKAD